ncbi:LuxR C-terminal-related transcriptional regulator [Flavobacterium noncentrifugens]|nr:LuxR C-terminal-related transcriptional regulator [Flavobacterium noncentrifugens]
MKLKYLLFLFLCFYPNLPAIGQADNSQKLTLDAQIAANNDLFMTKPDQAFLMIDVLMKKAVLAGNKDAELSLLSKKTWYFIRKTNLKQALKAAQELDGKAIQYENYYWQSAAHSHLLEICSFNGLQEQAIMEFDKSMALLEKSNQPEDKINYSKAINYIKIANLYETQGDFGKAKKMLLKVDEHIGKITDREKIRKIRFVNFTNLGAVNFELGLQDSAEYFIQKSIHLSDGANDEESLNQFRNLLILGQVYNAKKDGLKALHFLKKAEVIEPKLATNLQEKNMLYQELVESYKALDSSEQVNIYTYKAKDTEIAYEKNKSSSLKKIINDDLLKERNYSLYIVTGFSVLLLLSLYFIYRLHKKNKLLVQQETLSEKYLQDNKQTIDQETLSKLINLLKQHDAAFMTVFHGVFPDFVNKIQAIQPNVVQTEVEFCAYMKLNLTTKEISKILSIEPKSVQAKKYRIRKKLNIPNEVDIYMWFNQI